MLRPLGGRVSGVWGLWTVATQGRGHAVPEQARPRYEPKIPYSEPQKVGTWV